MLQKTVTPKRYSGPQIGLSENRVTPNVQLVYHHFPDEHGVTWLFGVEFSQCSPFMCSRKDECANFSQVATHFSLAEASS